MTTLLCSLALLLDTFVLDFLEGMVTFANSIFIRQLNLALIVDEILLIDSSNCQEDIVTQLTKFEALEKPRPLALWNLIDDCRGNVSPQFIRYCLTHLDYFLSNHSLEHRQLEFFVKEVVLLLSLICLMELMSILGERFFMKPVI